MTNTFLSLAILVWPFGQLLSLTPVNIFFRIQLLDLLAALLFFSVFVPKQTRQRAISDPLFRPLFSFVLVAILSLLLSQVITIAAIAYLLRFICYTSFYFAFRVEGVKKYYLPLALSAGIFLFLGFVQYIFLPDVRFLKYLGFDDHYYRLVGSLFDPNYSGAILASFSLLFLGFKFGWRRLLFLVPLFALALTFSRASYLSLFTGLLYLVFTRRRYLLLFLVALFPLLLFAIPKPFGEGVNLFRMVSIISRYQNQKEALEMFVKRPLLGHGFNILKEDRTGLVPNLSGVDNSFLFVAVTTGIIGLRFFVNFLFQGWKNLSDPFTKAAIIALMTHSFFNNTLFYSWTFAFLLFLFATRARTSL